MEHITRSWLAATALLIAGCGNGSGSNSSRGMDWSAKPLDATITNKVHGAGFKLSVPAGWKFDGEAGKEAAPDEITKIWRPDVKDYFDEPSVMIAFEAIPAKDLDGFVSDAMLDKKDLVLKREKTADGYVVVAHTANDGHVQVFVGKTKGANNLVCTASQSKTGGVPSPQATEAWLEKLCSSLTLD